METGQWKTLFFVLLACSVLLLIISFFDARRALNKAESLNDEIKAIKTMAIQKGWAEMYMADPNSLNSSVNFRWKE